MTKPIRPEWNHLAWGEPPLVTTCTICGKTFEPDRWEWRNRLLLEHSAHFLWQVCRRCRYIAASRLSLEKQGKL